MLGIKEHKKKPSFLEGIAIQLEDIPSNELEEFAGDFAKKDENFALNLLEFCRLPQDSDIFMYFGATIVLQKRHGRDYVRKLVGYKEPKTLFDKMQAYLFKQIIKQ